MIWGDKYLVNGLVIDRRFCYDIYLIICIYGFKNLLGRYFYYYFKYVYRG